MNLIVNIIKAEIRYEKESIKKILTDPIIEISIPANADPKMLVNWKDTSLIELAVTNSSGLTKLGIIDLLADS